MTKTARICKKHIGSKVDFMGRDEVMTGTVTKVQRGIASLDVVIKGQTYNTLLDVKSERIKAIYEVVGYSLSYDEIMKAAK